MPSRILKISFAALALVTALCACAPKTEPLHRQQIYTMGTLVEITLWTEDGALAQRGMAAVVDEMNRLHRTYHAWQPSALTDINAALAAGKPAPIDAEMRAVLTEAQALSAQSGGLFNPAIGELVELWGFHADDHPDVPPPDKSAIDALLARHPAMSDLLIEDTTLHSRNPAVRLDMGSYLKGYAVDRAVEQLRAMGITNAIVNAGGDLRAIGRHGDRPWRVGIRNPRGPGILAALDVQDGESVFTSGDYERYFTYEGKRYHHIIDPRTGYPPGGAVSATVIYPGGGVGGGASTALMVAGPEEWLETARRMKLRYVMLVGGDGRIYMTPAMADRVRFEPEVKPAITVGSTQDVSP